MLMTPSGWLDTLNVVLAILISMMASILALAVLEAYRPTAPHEATATSGYTDQAASEKIFAPSKRV